MIKNGYVVSMVVYSVPTMSNTRSSIRVVRNTASKCGVRQYTLDSNNYKQDDIGKSVEGICHGSYRISAVGSTDVENAIVNAKEHIIRASNRLIEQCKLTHIASSLVVKNIDSMRIRVIGIND
mgnify:CR=1 FL=1|tara:strand:- start:856 stop:1224 length:369 start_codon:yes stop_codon:yes gene_type:complete